MLQSVLISLYVVGGSSVCVCTHGGDSQEEDTPVQFYYQWDVVESRNLAVTRGGIHTDVVQNR